MANITAADGNYTFNAQQPPAVIAISAFLAALNIFLSITASLGNALILIALHKESSIYPPTKLFFRCLAVSDLCVGLITQPLYVILHLSLIVNINKHILHYGLFVFNTSSYILCVVSILTTTAISVDRLLALLLGIRYRHVVTLRRVRVVIICFWLLSCALAGWISSSWREDINGTVFFALIILSLLTSVFSYTKIYLRLRHNQIQVQGGVHQVQPPPNGGAIPLNIARYKKMVSTIVWVQLALFVCYLPFTVLGMITVMSVRLTDGFIMGYLMALSLVYLNSSLNPILYCWKIREVKQEVKNTIRQLNCCCES